MRAIWRGGNETILVVEDQPQLRRIAVRQLERLGYRILEAADADTAFGVLTSNANVDLLFTDVVMPGSMNGIMLATEARRLRPRLRILLTSGFADSAHMAGTTPACQLALLAKPYSRAQMAASVRAALDVRPGTTQDGDASRADGEVERRTVEHRSVNVTHGSGLRVGATDSR